MNFITHKDNFPVNLDLCSSVWKRHKDRMHVICFTYTNDDMHDIWRFETREERDKVYDFIVNAFTTKIVLDKDVVEEDMFCEWKKIIEHDDINADYMPMCAGSLNFDESITVYNTRIYKYCRLCGKLIKWVD